MLFLQRTTLHKALLSGGVRELVRTDADVVQVSDSAGRVRAKLRNGESLEADVLIGADGIGSKVRAGLLNDGPPTPSGLLAYRALTAPPPFEFPVGEYWGSCGCFGAVLLDGEGFGDRSGAAAQSHQVSIGRAVAGPVGGAGQRLRRAAQGQGRGGDQLS